MKESDKLKSSLEDIKNQLNSINNAWHGLMPNPEDLKYVTEDYSIKIIDKAKNVNLYVPKSFTERESKFIENASVGQSHVDLGELYAKWLESKLDSLTSLSDDSNHFAGQKKAFESINYDLKEWIDRIDEILKKAMEQLPVLEKQHQELLTFQPITKVLETERSSSYVKRLDEWKDKLRGVESELKRTSAMQHSFKLIPFITARKFIESAPQMSNLLSDYEKLVMEKTSLEEKIKGESLEIKKAKN
jgi:hypothetical protein